jgi:dTDP-4-amino-4,6-dideoxygalactose transaminase
MYGNARTWDYDAVRVGYRYHLSNLHAAIGLAQLGKLERIRHNRQEACRRYHANLADLAAVRLPGGDFDHVNPFLFWIRVPADDRDPLREHLAAQGIDTGIHWRPAHRHTYFKQFRRGPLPVTEQAGNEIVSLPLHSAEMPAAVLDRVSEAVRAYFS